MKTQDQIFFERESNQWFQRNKCVLTTEQLAHDPLCKLLDFVDLKPTNVLEVGASNGYRLQSLYEQFGCQVVAIEPSQEAIQDGQHRHSAVTFLAGSASAIPLQENFQFDLVIVNFVFHWIDRSTLLRSVAEIDRMIADGGYLAIGDFYPTVPQRVRYHHLPNEDVWTYKQYYADIFTASHLYSSVATVSVDHNLKQICVDAEPQHRSYVVLLQKRLTANYPSTRI